MLNGSYTSFSLISQHPGEAALFWFTDETWKTLRVDIRSAEKNGDTNCGNLIALTWGRGGQYPPAHMGSWGRWIWLSGSGTCVPRRLLEMKWVPGRRTGSLTQIKLCNVLSLFLNPHPDFLLSPSVALVPSSLSQCSSVPTPPPSNPALRCYSQVLGGKTKCLCPHFQNFYYLRSHLSSWKEGRP